MEYKGYLIKPVAKSYSVSTAGRGGKIPDLMQGLFTSVGVAIQVIDSYLESKDKKGKQDGEESDKSGS